MSALPNRQDMGDVRCNSSGFSIARSVCFYALIMNRFLTKVLRTNHTRESLIILLHSHHQQNVETVFQWCECDLSPIQNFVHTDTSSSRPFYPNQANVAITLGSVFCRSFYPLLPSIRFMSKSNWFKSRSGLSLFWTNQKNRPERKATWFWPTRSQIGPWSTP